MKCVCFFVFLFFYSLTGIAKNITWRDECIGYYQLQIPDNLDVGIYPSNRTYTKDLAMSSIFTEQKKSPGKTKIVKGRYSNFYYKKYKILISENGFFNIESYKEKVIKKIAEQGDVFHIKKYSSDAFFISHEESHSLYIQAGHRLYQFMKGNNDLFRLGDNGYLSNESGVLSLLNNFQARALYDVPTERGFCLPYGFISHDSGKEDRNIIVSYRMLAHPDVMIVFQDASFQLPYMVPRNNDLSTVKDYDAKDYAKWLWNHIYMLYPNQERKLLWPRWFTVKMDGRKGVGSFLEVTKENGENDYGYLAFVRGNPNNLIEEPDLQVFVSSVSDIAEGHPRMTPDELKALAEHIVNSVKHR
ncbi:hypothetical protein JAG29_003930 [Citrobacter freundii]|nr:hypothetical protein [Citrobacter freundii]